MHNIFHGNIFMVTDSSLNFGAGGCELPEFVTIVKSAGHTVATAPRPTRLIGN